MKRRTWVAATIVGAAVAVLGVGAVMAQSGGTSNTTGSSFLDRVAQKLGIESTQLKDAVTSVRTEDIDKALADGKITQAQADQMKQRLSQEADPLAGRGFGGPGFGFGGPGVGRGGPGGFGFLGAAEDQLATFLGIPKAQLLTELQADNATLATVAAAHGKSRDDLKTFITDTAKSKLDDAVKNGKLTQTMEDTILSGLSTNLDKLIDAHLPMGLGSHGFKGRHGGPGMGGPNGQGTSPAPGGTPGSGTRGHVGAGTFSF